jgi:hypothetical protein
MKHVIKYKLLKELPMYPAGTIITHEFDELPSQYNSGTYFSDGIWYTKDNVRASLFLEHLVKWCASSQRTDDNHDEWVKKL